MHHTIIAIDDEPVALKLLEGYLKGTEHTIRSFSSATGALEFLRDGGTADMILLDRRMLEMDGLDFLKALRSLENYFWVPVVMQTAVDTAPEIVESVAAGAHYYLTKPFRRDSLLSILERVLYDRAIHQGLGRTAAQVTVAMRSMDLIRLSFQSLDDVRNISFFIASLFPDPESARLGITELMINAIEHGNLGISYQEKSELTRAGTWKDEVERRLGLAEHRDKRGRISLERDASDLVLTIEDDGTGFDWSKFTTLDPLRASHSHGRGIAMAQMVSFDEVYFVAPGNKVVCRKRSGSDGLPAPEPLEPTTAPSTCDR